MPDRFENHASNLTTPAIGAYAVTPNNDADLTEAIRAITINGAGTVSYIWRGVTYTTGTLPVGTYAMRAQRIRATGTTATGITGWV